MSDHGRDRPSVRDLHPRLARTRLAGTHRPVRPADDAADFDHGYAFEARDRALACLGQLDQAGEVYRRAAATEIADDQDRSIYEAAVAAERWFGLERAD